MKFVQFGNAKAGTFAWMVVVGLGGCALIASLLFLGRSRRGMRFPGPADQIAFEQSIPARVADDRQRVAFAKERPLQHLDDAEIRTIASAATDKDLWVFEIKEITAPRLASFTTTVTNTPEAERYYAAKNEWPTETHYTNCFTLVFTHHGYDVQDYCSSSKPEEYARQYEFFRDKKAGDWFQCRVALYVTADGEWHVGYMGELKEYGNGTSK